MELLLDIDEKLCKCGCGASVEFRRPNVLFATRKCRDDYYNQLRADRKEKEAEQRKDAEREAFDAYVHAFPWVYSDFVYWV